MPSKILVVDDEPDLELLIRQQFRKQIRANEIDFVFAQNGVEALHKLDGNGDIELVLTDINMPQMDGLTLLSRLNEMEVLLKPVVVSAYGDMKNIRTAMNRGAYDFVTKPIDMTDLEITINKSLKDLHTLKDALQSRDKLVAIEQELNIATKIQTSILPASRPSFPKYKEFEICAKMLTAREVGGDLYDFFPIDEDRIGFVIGDVSGKGIPAAMMMTVSRTVLKTTALKGLPPHECLREANELLVDETLDTMFVTVFYGILSRNGEMAYCNGGHNPAYVISAGGGVEQVENVGGIFLGSLKGVPFESKKVKLNKNDIIFLYTDGVTEAEDKEEEAYEEQRLETCLKKHAKQPIAKIIDAVFNEVKTFSEGLPQTDDITCMAVKYQG